MLFKNVASQKIHVYAYDSTTGAAKTGDAANITGYVSLDGTANAIDDTNPTEVDATNMPGLYVFDLTQAETNCDAFALVAKSSTANIRIEPIIGFTTGAAVTQTGDAFARLGAPAGASVSADVAAVKSDSAAILEDTGTTLDTLIKDIPTVAEFEARTIAAADYLIASDTLARVTLVDTCTTNTDMRGTDSAALASVCTEGRLAELDAANLPADVAAVKAETASILEDTGTTLPGTLTTIAGYIDTEIAAILADTNELQTDWANGGRLDLILDAASAPSAAAVADAVWDEALSGHSNAGSAGLALATASSGGVDPSVLADAIWDEALSGHATAGTAGKKLTDLANADLSGVATAAALTTVDGIVDDIKAKTDLIPASPAAIGSAMTLTSAYDAAKTAASQTSVNAIPTGTLLADDARLDNLDATVSSRLAGDDYTAPANADIAVIKAKTDNLPSDPADQSAVEAAITAATSPLATAAALDAVDNYVDTEVAAIKAVTDKLDSAVELDGEVYRFTTNALEQAPSGSGLDAAGVRAAIGLASANLDTQLDALPTAAENADAVLDELLSEHTDVGSAGAGIAAAGSSGDPWATALPGAYAEGTAGNIIGTLSTPGSGSKLRVYSLTESTSGNPIVGATVTVTTDIAGTVVVASGTTDSGGRVEFYLDAGTYYLWRSCTGYTFADPDTEVFV